MFDPRRMNPDDFRDKARAKARAFIQALDMDFGGSFAHRATRTRTRRGEAGDRFVSFYDFLATGRFYDVIYGWPVRESRRAVISLMNLKPGDRVMEAGVGTGLSLPFYPAGVHVTGIDLSESMLEEARRRVTDGVDCNADILRMDAHNLDFPDNTFDKATAMLILSVVSDPVKVMNEIKRVCKPDADIFIVNRFASTHRLIRRFEKALRPLAPVLGFRTAEPLEPLISGARLGVQSARKVNWFNAWTLLHIKNDKA